jgi:ABC-type lipoprotein release transport system permease subunit
VYHLLLTRRYLTTKILPFLATIAVFLSTWTVIIAWSIMTGFLGVLLNSGRTLVGDVIIAWPSAGFGHYDELIADLEKDPAVKAATPVIEVLGVIKLPDNRIRPASVKGIDPESFARVTGFDAALWWRPLDEPMAKDKLGQDPRIVTIKPFLDALEATAPALRKGLESTRDLARERAGAEERAAALGALAVRVAALPKAGAAAVALAPNSTVRREATAAFLREAEAVLKESAETIEALRAAGTLTPDDLHAPEGETGDRLGDALLDYQDALLPVFNEYMHWNNAYENGAALRARDPKSGERVPAMLIGIEFTNYNQRYPEGYYIPKRGLAIRKPDGSLAPLPSDMLGRSLTLNVLPLDSSPSQFDLVSRAIPIANEVRSGLFEFDKSWVLVDLATVQNMVRLQAAQEVAPFDPYVVTDGPEGESLPDPVVVRESPARVTHVLVRGTGTAELTDLRARCEAIYEAFSLRHPADVPSSSLISITTWEEEQATLVGAVKKEIVMVLLILGVVSLTVSFLILAIFWAIVREKTKDIGILRAVGASRWSVCGLWLEYALITGLLGSVLGGLAGCITVWNINPIHDWLGRNLGLVIWDPRIYYFFEIPNKVDPLRVTLVMVAGTCFAVLGALIPAVRAAFMDPVKSLRFE